MADKDEKTFLVIEDTLDEITQSELIRIDMQFGQAGLPLNGDLFANGKGRATYTFRDANVKGRQYTSRQIAIYFGRQIENIGLQNYTIYSEQEFNNMN